MQLVNNVKCDGCDAQVTAWTPTKIGNLCPRCDSETYLEMTIRAVEKAAQLLGRHEDAARYRELAKRVGSVGALQSPTPNAEGVLIMKPGGWVHMHNEPVDAALSLANWLVNTAFGSAKNSFTTNDLLVLAPVVGRELEKVLRKERAEQLSLPYEDALSCARRTKSGECATRSDADTCRERRLATC